MRICCNKCGEGRIIFTTKGDKFGQHHGARYAACNTPITLNDLCFKKKRPGSEEETAQQSSLPPET